MDSYFDTLTLAHGDVNWFFRVPLSKENHMYKHWFWHIGVDIFCTLRQGVNTERLILDMATQHKYTQHVDFIHFRLQPDEEPIFKAWWSKEVENVAQAVETLLNSGYKLSIVPDFDNACHIITLIGKSTGTPNDGRAFTSRSDDWLEALGMTLYKHFVLAQGKVWPENTVGNNWG